MSKQYHDLTLNSIKVHDEDLIGKEHLNKLNISKKVGFLPFGAFNKNITLTKVYFEPGSSLKKIPDSCFFGCKSLNKINHLPESLVSIEHKAFAQCTGLDSIEIPKSVDFVSPTAFDGWKEHQVIYCYQKYEFTEKCQARIVCDCDEETKVERIIASERDETPKKYIVSAKCGHVGKSFYMPIDFPIQAKSGKEAAAIVREIGRVKHHHIDAIIDVRKVSEIEYDKQIVINKDDPYLKVKSKHEQNEIIDIIKDRRVLDTHYIPKRK